MKKFLLSLSLLTIIFSGCSTGDGMSSFSSRKDFALKGNVKSVRTITYDASYKFGELVKEDVQSYGDNGYLAFTESGYLAEQAHYAAGSLVFKMVYSYEGDILKEGLSVDEDGSINKKDVINVENGRVQGYVSYDSNGDKISETSFDYSGGNLSALNTYEDGRLISKTVRKYKQGKLVSEIHYGADGKESASRSFTYKSGTLKSVVLEIMQYAGSKGIAKEIYDAKGEVVVEKEAGEMVDGEYELEEIIACEYTYDPEGNWIKRVESDRITKEPKAITERTITYF